MLDYLVNKKNNINIHLSYHKVNNNLDSLILDSYNLVYEVTIEKPTEFGKHQVKIQTLQSMS